MQWFLVPALVGYTGSAWGSVKITVTESYAATAEGKGTSIDEVQFRATNLEAFWKAQAWSRLCQEDSVPCLVELLSVNAKKRSSCSRTGRVAEIQKSGSWISASRSSAASSSLQR